MIEIKDKCKCSGCSACEQRCPKQCISLKEDSEGFMYPFVDIENCINCGLCERVCPIINQGKPRSPLKVFAAKNKNEEIRLQSSSGGIFTLLAESIIQEGGVVFGARFDESWNVIHDYTETIEGMAAFRGSKYVQSRIGKSFRQVESFLKTGRKVMFTGTPCQVSGLKHYLIKEYDNLLTVDFVCHGVPSPKTWQLYLQEEITRELVSNKGKHKSNAVLTDVNFRDKSSGWKEYNFLLCFSVERCVRNRHVLTHSFTKNPYMNAFLSNITLRPSCYHCKMKNGASNSDYTLGDYWGIDSLDCDIDDNKGYSIVIDWNQRMKMEDMNIHCVSRISRFSEIISFNRSFVESSSYNPNRSVFFYYLNKYSSFNKAYSICFSKNVLFRVFRMIIRKFIK